MQQKWGIRGMAVAPHSLASETKIHRSTIAGKTYQIIKNKNVKKSTMSDVKCTKYNVNSMKFY